MDQHFKMKNKFVQRVVFDIVLTFITVSGPWWLLLPCIVVALSYFKTHYESLAAAFALDALYGTPFLPWSDFWYVWSVAVGLLFLIIELFKRRLRASAFR